MPKMIKMYDCERDRKRAEKHRRKARQRNLLHNLTNKQWVGAKTIFENRCAYCGSEESLTQDHFIPVCRNGEYTANNIVPACHTCNSSKSDQDFFEWYPQQTFYNKKREQKILKYLNYKNGFQQLAI
jgi:5-methylcytosine-specific restriction endonuclease McrA